MTSRFRAPLSVGERLREAVQTLGDRLLGREACELAVATARPMPRAAQPATLRAVSMSAWSEPPRQRAAASRRDRRSGSDRRRRDVGAPYGVERRSGADPRTRPGGR